MVQALSGHGEFPAFPPLERILEVVKSHSVRDILKLKLGGSNDARKIEVDGNHFVYKPKSDGSVGGSNHVRSEQVTNEVLRAIGVPVPVTKFYDNPNGDSFLLSEFIELKKFETDEQLTPEQLNAICSHYVAHTVMGNHDVIGRTYDNTQLCAKTKLPIFIDNGGALNYTGTGKDKTKLSSGRYFSDNVRLEMDRMRGIQLYGDPEITLPEIQNAGKIFLNVSPPEIRVQIERIIRQKGIIRAVFQEASRRTGFLEALPAWEHMESRINSLIDYLI